MIWFRMLWMIFTARFLRPLPVMSEHRLSFHCLPTDIDLNVHMTNSRYLTFFDQARFSLLLRSSLWRRMRRVGIGPVVGTMTVRFRKQVRTWQRFEVTARIITWDERWVYIDQKIITGSDVCALAIVKVAFVNKNGRIPAEEFAALLAEGGTKPPMTDLVAATNALDQLMKA